MLRGEGAALLGRAWAWPRLVAPALAMIAFVATAPAASSAAVQCSYSAHDHVLAVSVTGNEIGEIVRSGSQVVPRGSPFDEPPQCEGAPAGGATVFNTDRVQITSKKDSSMWVELSGGPFAPGATDEGDGSSEIEFEGQGPDPLGFVVGTSGRDVLTWGTDGGVNLNPGLNGDVDSDVINRGSGLLAGMVVSAEGGPDLVAPQVGFVGGPHQSWGGSGNDVLRSATNGSILQGGRGNDTLIGGKGGDYITGGRGRDRIRAGKKSDLIEVADGRADTVFCGGGRDKGKADPVDKLRGCEQVRRANRRRASASSGESGAASPLLRAAHLWARWRPAAAP